MRNAVAGLLLLLAFAAGSALGQTSIVNSKHNLSTSGPGTIKSAASGGTAQVCVFCHTPHGASAVAQLWNRELPVSSYTLYSSDYLTSLGYALPSQPKTRSKLCLSCHDGTIALGSVYNLPGSGGYSTTPGTGIPMEQSGVAIPGGTMPTNAIGYLGTNLTDDHPVGYLYDTAKDPELVATRTWPWGTPVKLDPDASNGTVECQTCHNPHNDQYGKFLRMSNVNGALCTFCHNKSNWPAGAHANATGASYTPAGGTATTVAAYACLSCHKPHSSGGTPYVLRGAEEATCYERGCHGSNTANTDPSTPATPAARLIQPELSKTHAHPVNSISGLHKNVSGGESATQLGGALAVNRHAECMDCHNPHQAEPTVTDITTRGALRISAALKGSWGVEPTWPTPPTTTLTNNSVTFAPLVSFTRVSGASLTDEYQVCLKCHSNYVTLPAGARNIGEEINPLNSSYHGIVPGGTPNSFVNTTTANEPWATNHRVWCSDCHGSEAGSGVAPKGPHGSNNNGTAPGTSNTDKMLVATIASTSNGTPLCLVCHKSTSYATNDIGSNNTRHGTASMTSEGCFACHMWSNAALGGDGKIYPHGMNARWYTWFGGAAGSGSGQMVDKFNGGWYTNMDYTTKQCWATNSSGGKISGSPCGTHANGGTY